MPRHQQQEEQLPQPSTSYSNPNFDYPRQDSQDRTDYTNQSFAEAVRTPGGSADGGMASTSMPFSACDLLSLTSNSVGQNPSSPIGLPVYSASGFDLLSILARVATRPHPKIVLGPVDLTCSFVVVDVRRYDSPIVYASPTFCQLTGYSEQEALGRNCRFLQSPDGTVKRGEGRRYVAPETVQHMYKSVVADKECQVSIINYRKNGQAFINLVTIIPILGGLYGRPDEADSVVYHVGFQVDLTEQPNAILQKLKDGSYVVNYGNDDQGGMMAPTLGMPPIRDRKTHSSASSAVSKTLKAMLSDTAFLDSLPLTKAASVGGKEKEEHEVPVGAGTQTLSLLLLENAPDFIHVLSLKGSFLYVAPSVRRVLGFEAEELIGKSIADYCHPADLVPLMRELKESSTVSGAAGEATSTPAGLGPPKTVDLLFRAQAKDGGYVWIECRGRLHVEPGKGRKAIILSGRTRGMPSMAWGAVAGAGGITPAMQCAKKGGEGEREFWGMVSRQGTLLVVGGAVRHVLGWGTGEVIGRGLASLVSEGSGKHMLLDKLRRITAEEGAPPVKVLCEMIGHEGQRLPVRVVLYRAHEQAGIRSPAPVICQIKLMDATTHVSVSPPFAHRHGSDIFEELGTGRGTSWQYELQQLKFANQRLVDEVAALETAITGQPRSTSGASHSFPGRAFDEDQKPAGLPVARPVRIDTNWATPQMRDYDGPQRSLKRSWGEALTPA